KLDLSFYPLRYNEARAREHFAVTKQMLHCFEYWLGPYPFYEDGYKLIETPHLGMEHQSGVAYGNHYQNGYLGRDLSGTGWGLKWDFIVVHESGHEWFGNNITMKDAADMWIHESFTNYSESLFVEQQYGKQAGLEYTHGNGRSIQNNEPIIGVYNVNKEGSGDMYPKGGIMLNMIRTIINNDEKWLAILRGLNKTFYHQTVTTEQVVNYINQQSGLNLTTIFDQYLRYKNIPTLEFRLQDKKLVARWISDVNGFSMPVKIKLKGGEYQFFNLGTSFSTINLPMATKDNIDVDTFNYYIGVVIN
ncbi:MAG: M1 family peptidase, partial [Sphingobacteriaceae bacterium]